MGFRGPRRVSACFGIFAVVACGGRSIGEDGEPLSGREGKAGSDFGGAAGRSSSTAGAGMASAGRAGSSSSTGAAAAGGTGAGGVSGTGAGSSSSGAATAGMAGMPAFEPACKNVKPCESAIQGTWTVADSCLEVSGSVDLRAWGLGCATAPIRGTMQVSGAFSVDADGRVFDETTTWVQTETKLPPDCLTVSGVPVICGQLGQLFVNAGYQSGLCQDFAGTCHCWASDEQSGGMGLISETPIVKGWSKVDQGNLVVSDGDEAHYSYCSSSQQLSVTPGPGATLGTTVNGSIYLNRQ